MTVAISRELQPPAGVQIRKIMANPLGWVLWHKTPKFMTIDLWYIGVLLRLLQILVLVYFIFSTFSSGAWAYSETPLANINAWGETGGARAAATAASAVAGSDAFDYCSNEAYSYKWSDVFNYEAPECEWLETFEVVEKGKDIVSFTTVYIEQHVTGWPLAAADNEAKTTECASAGGTTTDNLADGERICTRQRAVYPTAVEEMKLVFSHGFEASAKIALTDPFVDSTADGLNGTSHDCGEVNTEILAADGTAAWYEAGRGNPAMSVKDWLALADIELDDENPIPADGAGCDAPCEVGAGCAPRFRTTGVVLHMDVSYSNRLEDDRVPLFNSNISAKISVRAETKSWAGDGPRVAWIEYPTGAPGSRTYHKVIQYRQGVQFQFRSTGRLYTFEIQYFVGVIVSAIVLFKVAGTITDYVAFYLICCGGQSAMLRRIRAGNVSKDEEVARVGMRAALAATQFRHFDANNDGRLTTEDLVRVFAMVDGVTLEKAHAIARRVLDHAEKKGDEGLTYKDFVTQLEEDFSERHTFDHFLKQLRPVTEASTLKRTSISGGLDAEVERCRQAYDDVKGGGMMPVIEAQKADGTTTPPKQRASVGGTPQEPPPQPQAAPPQPPPQAAPPQPLYPQMTPLFQHASAPPGAGIQAPNTITLRCYNCGQVFGSVTTAKVAECPHCKAHNAVPLSQYGAV